MLVSPNEIERTVERAARGAGAVPGADTELGLGTGWLMARGVAVLGPVARALEAAHKPRTEGLVLVHALPVLADLAAADAIAGGTGRIEAVAADVPALLVPVAWGYAAEGLAFELAWTDAADGSRASAAVGPGAAWQGALLAERARDVTVACRRTGEARGEAPPAAWTGIEVPDAAWAILLRLAHRTYVPASTLSRSRGAGAEVDDSA